MSGSGVLVVTGDWDTGRVRAGASANQVPNLFDVLDKIRYDIRYDTILVFPDAFNSLH